MIVSDSESEGEVDSVVVYQNPNQLPKSSSQSTEDHIEEEVEAGHQEIEHAPKIEISQDSQKISSATRVNERLKMKLIRRMLKMGLLHEGGCGDEHCHEF